MEESANQQEKQKTSVSDFFSSGQGEKQKRNNKKIKRVSWGSLSLLET